MIIIISLHAKSFKLAVIFKINMHELHLWGIFGQESMQNMAETKILQHKKMAETKNLQTGMYKLLWVSNLKSQRY